MGEGVPQAQSKPDFEVIAESTSQDDNVSQFVVPNARLLRSMRRCDRKLLPLLDKWVVVDVVMTKHEIVYFDATDIDDTVSEGEQKMLDIREAIIATKGGKGLRLRDVAYGRRVVGHQELSTIESIQVERVLPHENHEVASTDICVAADEYWKPKASKVEAGSSPSRECRWSKVKEDRLKIKTKHDTLYLRFYSDLEGCESHLERVANEKEDQGPLFKNNALQWCQTLGRLCGTTQLHHQNLDHFGDNDDGELRDYLVIVDTDGHEKRRKTRFGLAAPQPSGIPESPTARRPYEGQSSFDSAPKDDENKPKFRKGESL